VLKDYNSSIYQHFVKASFKNKEADNANNANNESVDSDADDEDDDNSPLHKRTLDSLLERMEDDNNFTVVFAQDRLPVGPKPEPIYMV